MTIHAKAPNIARDYEVEGSVNTQKIKELSLKQQDLREMGLRMYPDT